MRRTLTIARLETRLTLVDPIPFILLIGIPIVFLAFMSKGVVGGPAQSVPGLVAMFGMFGIPVIGLAFFRDHGWNTWDRLRASPARPAEVLAGKVLPLLALLFAQQAVLLLVGHELFSMPWRGSVAQAALLIGVLVLAEAALAMLIVSVCRSVDQLTALAYLGALLLGGFGGGLAPLSRLPDWVNDVAPASPVYWALRGLRVVVRHDVPTSHLFVAVGVLGAFAAGAGLLTAWRFRFDEPKRYFAD